MNAEVRLVPALKIAVFPTKVEKVNAVLVLPPTFTLNDGAVVG
jgi:hypothetical protein